MTKTISRFRTQYNSRVRGPGLVTPEPPVVQSFQEECDINAIMKRYQRTGVLPESVKAAAARYGDFSSIPSFHEMQDRVIAAHEMFGDLPAAVRKAFDNDPGEFIAAADTPEGIEKLKALGLGKEELAPLAGVSPAISKVVSEETEREPTEAKADRKARSKPSLEG